MFFTSVTKIIFDEIPKKGKFKSILIFQIIDIDIGNLNTAIIRSEEKKNILIIMQNVFL